MTRKLADVIAYRYRGSIEPDPNRERVRAELDTANEAATIRLFDVIDSFGGWWGISANEVRAALDTIGDDVKTLEVHVNSPGGEATEGVAIANVLRMHPAAVHVTVVGLAASAASLIAVSGDRVTVAPGAMMMIHDAWNIVAGNSADMAKEAGILDQLSANYAAQYARKGGGEPTEWRELMIAETWFSDDEAVEAGLADDVLETGDAAASANARAAARRFDLSVFRHPPADLGVSDNTPLRRTGVTLSGKGIDDPPAASAPAPHKQEGALMPDAIPVTGLVKALGLPDDADEDAILEAVEDKVRAAAANAPAAVTTDTDPADDAEIVSRVVAALEADGKVIVSQAFMDALKDQASQGAAARARQLRNDRDEAIAAAQSDGRISRAKETRESWEREFGRDPERAKADLDSLSPRFPVGDLEGHQGDGDVAAADMTEAEADEFGSMLGVSGKALTR